MLLIFKALSLSLSMAPAEENHRKIYGIMSVRFQHITIRIGS